LLGGETNVPQLLIKRDDLNGTALGGNKLRKLEWLAGEAEARGCDTLITAGAAQSNHCRQTAAVAAMRGLECHLCLRGPEPERHTGNLILDDWLGAHLHFAPPGENVSSAMLLLADELRAGGRRPYMIPLAARTRSARPATPGPPSNWPNNARRRHTLSSPPDQAARRLALRSGCGWRV
jgi:1-aminocyclopropane-1-carboxylate deaminase/D-cysteine desulfhydrase-like pyridoxal-dependent ACC family enzyme